VPRVIYEPRGRAKEYSPLACNLYRGCSHGCLYCYAPSIQFTTRQDWTANISPRNRILHQLKLDAEEMRGDQRTILFSFLCDPYQPIDVEHKITRSALEILGENGYRVQVLTKGGKRALRDFDLLKKYKFMFGSTVLFSDESLRKKWEPYASPIEERTEVIKEAHRLGIFTWVSLEPVIEAKEALKVIEALHGYVDFWKVGKLNHMPAIEGLTDWANFYDEVTRLFLSIGADYYIKNDLLKYVVSPLLPRFHARNKKLANLCPSIFDQPLPSEERIRIKSPQK
jgi:hypothetical protein